MKITEEMLTEEALKLLDVHSPVYLVEYYVLDPSAPIVKQWYQYRVERMMPMGMVFFTEDP